MQSREERFSKSVSIRINIYWSEIFNSLKSGRRPHYGFNFVSRLDGSPLDALTSRPFPLQLDSQKFRLIYFQFKNIHRKQLREPDFVSQIDFEFAEFLFRQHFFHSLLQMNLWIMNIMS